MTVAPFKGLQPFEDSPDDVRFFFGREREREIISANLMASRLTVLYGETGVGKSSVLRAGVAHSLRALARSNVEERGRPELAVAVFDRWRDDPVTGLVEAVREAVVDACGADVSAPDDGRLADRVQAWAELLNGEIYVILDGVEEYFLYHDEETGPGSFAAEFPEAVRRPGLRVSFLVALREDALGKLDRFKASIPNLFGNYLRLDHLDRDAGRRAIVGPVEQYNEEPGGIPVEIEPGLAEVVLDEVQAGRVEMGDTGRGAVEGRGASRRIETPFLQLVMRRLWDEERAAESRVLRLSTLRRLGGAEQIVRDHLERALGDLSPHDRDVAAEVFNYLVTPSGTKIAHEPADLARYAGVSEAELDPVLTTLTRERVLRPTAAANGHARFEIFHDVLGGGVLAWRAEHDRVRELERSKAQASRRHRRLTVALGVGAILLAAMAGVTAYAIAQRGEAQTQARRAQARQLDSSAVSQLATDPQLSLLLAAEAARTVPSPQAETTLRTAFIASRQRGAFAAGGPVVAAEYSPDGKYVLVAGEDGVFRMYDSASRERVLELDHGGPAKLVDAAFSADGRRVVTAAADGTARMWDVASGGRLLGIARHGSPVQAVAFDPTGTRVVTAGGRSARVWSATGEPIATLRSGKPVTSARFGPGGRLLVVTGRDRFVRLYDAAAGRLVRELDQGGQVTAAVFNRGGGLLATGGDNDLVRLWRVRDGKLLHELKGHRGSILAAAFSPRGSRLATASADGTGRIWSVSTGELVASILGHKGYVDAVAFSPDGNFVVTGSTDRTARVWKADNGDGRALLAGHGDSVRSVSFSPDGGLVLTGSGDGTARLWDPAVQPKLARVAGVGGPVLRADYVGDGARILVVGPGSAVRILRTDDGQPVRTLRARGPVRAAAASLDGSRVAVASDRTVRVHPDRGPPVVLAFPDVVTAVAFSPDGEGIVAGGKGGGVWIRPAGGGPLLALGEHPGEITDVGFSPDGTRVVSAGADKVARIWEAGSGRLLRTLEGHRDAVTSASFSPDGRLVLTASRDHDGRLWDAESGDVLQVLRAHFGRVADASFSPDGRWMLTAGPTTAMLWQPGVRDPILPYGFGGHDAPLTSAVFDPAGRFVMTAADDGTVRRAKCVVCRDLAGMLDLADAQLEAGGRSLAPDERARYGL